MLKVNDLFELRYGHSLELNALTKSNSADAVNFVGRAARNNGVTSRVAPLPGVTPGKAGTITVALGGQGGAGVAFLQPSPYYCGRDVMILTPRASMTDEEKLWWTTCITANRFRFGFGRQANRTLKNVALPASVPKWVSEIDLKTSFDAVLAEIAQLSKPSPATAPLVVSAERSRVSDLFDVTYGTSLELNRLTLDDNGVNFIARTARNNGVAAKVVSPAGLVPLPGHCLTVAVGGSVLETFMQKDSFLTGFHVMVLRPRIDMSAEELIFYAACIRANQGRYSYGRQANRTLKDLLIPAKSAVPQFVYGSCAKIGTELAQRL
jgi:hypothetical protein